MASGSRNRLPWVALLIPLGYLPGYFGSAPPDLASSGFILAATFVAWFGVAWLGREGGAGGGGAGGGSSSGSRGGSPPPSGDPARSPGRTRAPSSPPAGPPRARGSRGGGAGSLFADTAWLALLAAAATFFAAQVTAGALARVEALGRSEAFSVGIFQQALWWTKRGVAMGVTYSTTDASLHRQFGIHFSPLLMALSPLYAARPAAATLLQAQAVALGAAALPLYLFARLKVGRLGAGLIALAWLLQPTILGAPLSGFHDLAFAPFFIFLALWAMARNRWWLYLPAILALLALREDLAFFVILLAIPAAAMRARSRFSAGSIFIGGAWLAVCLLWIIPHYRTPVLRAAPDVFFQQYLGSWGATPLAVLQHLATHPMDLVHRLISRDALRYLLSVLRPIGFLLPLPDPAWLAGLQNLGLNMVAEGGRLKDPLARYSIPVVAAFFISLPAALAAWGRAAGRRGAGRGGRAGSLAFVVVMAAVLSLVLMRVDRGFHAAPRADVAAQRAVLAAVPDSVAVLAPDYAYARLANRACYACLGSLQERALEPAVLGRFDAVLLDLAPDSFELRRFPQLGPALLEKLRADRGFREANSAGDLHLFLRVHPLSPQQERPSGR